MILLDPYQPDEAQPVWDYTIALGDDTYRAVITYRERQDSYYLDLYTAEDVKLVSGKRLSIYWPILERRRVDGMPAGVVVLIDTADVDEYCQYADLGHRCQLAYFDRDDLPAAAAAEGITITTAAI